MQAHVFFDAPEGGVFQRSLLRQEARPATRRHVQRLEKEAAKGGGDEGKASKSKVNTSYGGVVKRLDLAVAEEGVVVVQGHNCRMQRVYIMENIAMNSRRAGFDLQPTTGAPVAYILLIYS